MGARKGPKNGLCAQRAAGLERAYGKPFRTLPVVIPVKSDIYLRYQISLICEKPKNDDLTDDLTLNLPVDIPVKSDILPQISDFTDMFMKSDF